MTDLSSSDGEFLEKSDETDTEMEIADDQGEITPSSLSVGVFCLIRFQKKSHVVYYVAKILKSYSPMEYQVSFLRKKTESYKFIFPVISDEASVHLEDIIQILTLRNKGTTKRTSSLMEFSQNLSRYNCF